MVTGRASRSEGADWLRICPRKGGCAAMRSMVGIRMGMACAVVSLGLLIGTAYAQEAPDTWTDTVTFTLEPGDTAEIKLTMAAGDVAEYAWTAEGGRVNFDLHAHSGGESIDYERGSGATDGEGSIEAPFAGDHGWFWRNRDSTPITMTINVRGDYSAVVETY